jgi:hypothetical protein
MTTINVSGQITNEDLLLCDSTKLLMNCRDFYILLERFCNGIGKSNPQYDEFLNLYFNDEGYVDIWRIPHLMLDAFNQNLKFHKVLQYEEFRITFHQFLTELYNFCLSECQSSLMVKPDSSSTQTTLRDFKIRQQFLSTVMATFINVMENIENYEKAETKL